MIRASRQVVVNNLAEAERNIKVTCDLSCQSPPYVGFTIL
jgi:hypothetical protein